jgi:hypothetical protein
LEDQGPRQEPRDQHTGKFFRPERERVHLAQRTPGCDAESSLGVRRTDESSFSVAKLQHSSNGDAFSVILFG